MPAVRAQAPAEGIHVDYPSLVRGRAQREESVHKGFRLPLSMWMRLRKLEDERGTVPSDFVRDCIAKGLAEIEASELKENT